MALSTRARAFCRSYPSRLPLLEEAASQLEAFIADMLHERNFDLHLVSARAKSFTSMLSKIRRKGYRDPNRRLTDQLGVRVITYYESDVDPVAYFLRLRLEVDDKKSVDKRTQLNIREFGYRSVHLIARLREADARQPRYATLGRQLFEVQIRSILEHAWAEIEHETNYKAGVSFSDPYMRRFGAIAGSLEILEAQFLAQKKERNLLIDKYKTRYQNGEDRNASLDAARLLALLELLRPNGLSWRHAEELGNQFAPRLEATCVSALDAVSIRSADQLTHVLRQPRFRGAVRRFASSIGLDPGETSHFAIVVIAVGITNRDVLLEEYPELAEDISLRNLFSK
jgi:ppGpp synthetase/RelA/SpoT-type nucleotidyltranferase